MLKAPPFAMTEDGIPNSESFIYSHLPATCGIRSPLCRSLNNLHLHLSLGMPGFISPEFLVEDVSVYCTQPDTQGRCILRLQPQHFCLECAMCKLILRTHTYHSHLLEQGGAAMGLGRWGQAGFLVANRSKGHVLWLSPPSPPPLCFR